MKKIGLLIILSLIFGYSLVFSELSNIDQKISIGFISSSNIYLNSSKLNSVLISFKSNKELKDYSIFSNCRISSRFIRELDNEYFFYLKYLDKRCSNANISLYDPIGKIVPNILLKFKLIKEGDLYGFIVDLSNEDLLELYNNLKNKLQKYSLFSKYIKGYSEKSFVFLLKNRSYSELKYNLNIIKNIIEKRTNKYSSPVLNYKISRKYSKLPNAGRPYRNSYTDGIHHGWDIDAPYGTNVIALDDGIIIRVVSDYSDKDFAKINKKENLTYNQELINLDLLRGNQVWLKTMKGEIVFYSHLSVVSKKLKKGIIIKKGEYIGNIGISGIPGNNYKDYHLHFTIHENPYYKFKAGKYNFLDYMKWDRKFKGKSREYILKNTNTVFQ